MIVECGHCGGPLDVREGQRFTRCRYCGKTSQSRELRTIEQQTPPGWRPPPVWRPPPHVPADSGTQLSYDTSNSVAAIVVFATLISVIAAGAVGAILMRSNARSASGQSGAPAWPGGPKRLEPQALAKVTMKESPEALEELTGVAMDAQHTMRVPLAHPSWEAVTFRWDPEHLDHVREVFFNGKAAKGDPSVRKAIKAVVGRRLQKDSFQWDGCGLHLSNANDYLGVNITVDQPGAQQIENPHWRKQSEALWKLARSAALGVGDVPSPVEVRDWLGGGHPVAALGKLDPSANIDESEAAVKSLFPGAVRRLFIDLDYKVALDHPWYGEAQLAWKNKKGARLAEISLDPPPGANNKFADQKAVDDCVTAAFGKPKRESEGQHVGGSRDTTWNPAGGGSIRVYEHMLVITLRDSPFSSPMSEATFHKTIDALDRCGRKAD